MAYRNLQAATSGGGEGEGPSQNYYDVNNDGWIGLDAITIVNRLNGEGEGNPYARLVLQPVALNTNDVITTITKGQSYELRVLTVDLGETMFMSQTRNTAISRGLVSRILTSTGTPRNAKCSSMRCRRLRSTAAPPAASFA